MKFLKQLLLKKNIKIIGSLSLFLAAIVLTSTSSIFGYQPKCPDEFLK